MEAAYVFRRVENSWIEQQKLTASDYKDFSAPKGGSHERKYLDISRFGCSVDISGSIRNTADDFVPGDTIVGLRTLASFTLQRRVRHACRRTPLPPKTGMSTHEMHVPQLTELRQPEQRPHLEVTLPLPPPPLWPKPLP